MTSSNFRHKSLTSLLFTLLLIVSSQLVLAGDNGNGKGKGKGSNKNVGVGNASDGIAGKIITNKHVVYTGNPLEISLKFSRGADLVTDGTVDAYVVIFAPAADVSDDDDDVTDESTDGTDSTSDDSDAGSDTDDDSSGDDANSDAVTDTVVADIDALADAVVLPVSSEASSDSKKLFELEAVDASTLPVGTYQLGLILTNPGGDPLVINDWYKGLLGLINIVGLTISDEAVPFDADGDGLVDDDANGNGFSDDDEDDGDDDSDSSSDDDADDSSSDSSGT